MKFDIMKKSLENNFFEAIFAIPEKKEENIELNSLINKLKEKGYKVSNSYELLSELPKIVTPNGYIIKGIRNISFYLNIFYLGK
jgi:hypothetical protein